MADYIKKIEDISELKPGQHWITVQKLGSGWAAVDFWINPDDEGEVGFPFPEPWQTGIGRYDTKEEAIKEAKGWALDEALPLHIPA